MKVLMNVLTNCQVKARMGVIGSTVLSIGVSMALASSAWAGETIALKSGTIRLEDQSQNILSQNWSQSRGHADGAAYFVVQFESRISSQMIDGLKREGIEVKRYLPEDALLVRATGEQVALAKLKLVGIRAVAPYQAEWKLDEELIRPSFGQRTVRKELMLVSAFDAQSAQEVLSALRWNKDVEVQGLAGHDVVVRAAPEQAAAIAQIQGVEWVQTVPVFETFDLPVQVMDVENRPGAQYEYTGYESGTRIMGFEAARSRGYYGQGQVVAMADTGLDTGVAATLHPDFKEPFLKGYAMGLGGKDWGDPQGHGTHVAGSVVGTGKASDGKIQGGAPQAKFVAEGLWSPLLDNLAPGSDFNRLMGTPYQDGARIHTNSWGSPQNLGSYDTYAARVDEFVWNNPEMLVLFAAGNSGEDKNRDGRIDDGSVSSPGTAKNVLTVGASENVLAVGGIQKPHAELRDGQTKWGVEPLASDRLSDDENGLAAFSSRGPTRDGRLKPEIVAPGTNIVSARSKHPRATPLWGEFNADYVYAGGTSMATPLTAGAAAVVREYLVKSRALPAPSAAMVKVAMMHSAKDLFPGQYGTGAGQELPKARPNVHEGYGRVDVDHATRPDAFTLVVDDKVGVGLNEEKVLGSFTLKARRRQASSLRVTMSYADAPAAVAAAKALVNDIDLVVVGPAGKVYQLSDRVNNTEMLELNGLPAGEYQIKVKGINVPTGKNGKQPFAVAATQF